MTIIDRNALKKIIDKNLRFWVSTKKQNKIADLLVKTPCTCASDPEKCDRHWLIDHPDYKRFKLERKMKDISAITKYLAADYTNLEVLKQRKTVCELPSSGKYIILSDIHQGSFAWSWDQHDFFWKNKEIYHTLLEYYLEKDFTLIEAGDIEEFWLKRSKKTFDEHWAYQLENFPELYESRQKFHTKNRYIKLRGNHDNLWFLKDRVKNYLWRDAQLDQLKIYEFITIGSDFLITHGHQIDRRNRDCDSKKGLVWTKFGGLIEFFIDSVLFGLKKPPHGWRNRHPQVELIYKFQIEQDVYRMTKFNRGMAKLAKFLKVPIIFGHNHAPKCLPEESLIFNSGCGVFEGIVYGIEINYDEDVIRLVDWNDDQGIPSEPVVLCEESISQLREKT